MKTYRVFSRKVYRVERGPLGLGKRYIPIIGNKRTVRTGLTMQEAIELCKKGPANIARDRGEEYRHLSFYEFEAE